MNKLVVRPDGMLLVDGIPVFRKVTTPTGSILIEFCDKDKNRSACRGSNQVLVSLEELAIFLAKTNEST